MTSDERRDEQWVSAVPLPRARPPRVDLAFAQPRSAETIAIDIVEWYSGYLYVAVSADQSWSGVAAAPNAAVAVLEAIDQICTMFPEHQRIRFVVNLGAQNALWRYAAQIASAPTNWWVERTSESDLPLVREASALLEHVRLSPPAPQVPRIEPGSITVATDGSVRRTYGGIGWLTACGAFGLGGYRSSTKRDGRSTVLVAELWAIGDAIHTLPRRKLIVLTDSLAAVEMVDQWKRGDEVMPADYPTKAPGTKRNLHDIRRRIYVERHRIELRWVRGHSGDPLNEGADALARLGSRFRRGDRDLDEDEYRRRAAGIAKGFAAEYRRINQAPS